MNTLITITGIGILAMLSEIFSFRKALFPLVLIGLIAALGFTILDWNTNVRYYSDMMYFDNYAIAFSAVIISTTVLWFMLSSGYLRGNSHQTDYTSLIL